MTKKTITSCSAASLSPALLVCVRGGGDGTATTTTTSPRDVATGQASGKRQWQPVL